MLSGGTFKNWRIKRATREPLLCAKSPMQPSWLNEDMALFSDGRLVDFRRWPLDEGVEATGTVLGLHGFADYSAAFDVAAQRFHDFGYEFLAFDQRGFGATDAARLVCDADRLMRDVADAVELVRTQQGKEKPLLLLGESMGGAVALAAVQKQDLPIDGLLLAPPAVWTGFRGRSIIRSLSQLIRTFLPGATFKVNRIAKSGLISPTAQRLQRDPKASAEVAPDVIAALLTVMERASRTEERLQWPTLCLFGEDDRLLRKGWINARFKHEHFAKVESIPGGTHLILHDVEQSFVYETVENWLVQEGLI